MSQINRVLILILTVMLLGACGDLLTVEDKRISPDGDVYEGSFDRYKGKLIEGKITFFDGTVEEGTRDKDTGFLIEGKVTFPDGEVYEGTFGKDTGRIIEGKIIFADGEVQEGKFDKDTGLLIEGKIIFPDGRISDGRFDKVPVCPSLGYKINPLDKGNQMSFEKTLEAYQDGSGDGIGIVLTGESVTYDDTGMPLYLIGVDLDKVKGSEEKLYAAKTIIKSIKCSE